jgi:hypothetical protein
MQALIAMAVTLCWCGAIPAQKDQSTDTKARLDRLIAIQNEIAKATAEARKKIAEMTDVTEKRTAQQALNHTINELRPKIAAKSLALAKENPKDDIGLTALIDAYAEGSGTAIQEEARRLITEHHYANPKIEQSLPNIAQIDEMFDLPFLKKIIDKNPSKTAKALASYYLAKGILTEAEGSKIKEADIQLKMNEAIAVLEKLSQDYGDMELNVLHGREKAGDLARKEIEQIKKSPIGKVTPEITADDLDGTNFKISDYRGKVVLLDFWGHW